VGGKCHVFEPGMETINILCTKIGNRLDHSQLSNDELFIGLCHSYGNVYGKSQQLSSERRSAISLDLDMSNKVAEGY
jgi:hypothetical protein